MKILTVVGARPQFIKAATISRAITNLQSVTEVFVHTGQHYDDNMSQIFFSELEIPHPHYNLGIGGGHHGAMTGRQLEAIEKILLDEKPDWVLVYGDTNSTLAAALAAVKLNISVAHVEAGLRSFNRAMPEEINRVLTDHAADLLFAPTESAIANLECEGLLNITHLSGDVMYDAALFYAAKAAKQSTILFNLNLTSESYILATVHRAENTDNQERITAIVSAMTELGAEKLVVFPIHPRTRLTLDRLGLIECLQSAVKLIDPVGYLDMVMLEKHASLIVTDSGGVQKEAFFHQVPCVTLRNETEWVELVELGWNRLVLQAEIGNLLSICTMSIGQKGRLETPYGNGNSANNILELLVANSHT
jgi:UDP-GlcNAc3NAcA epimerase